MLACVIIVLLSSSRIFLGVAQLGNQSFSSSGVHSTHLASSSSSVRWMASVSYLVLHWATSLLALDIDLCSSALASCSSSYCSRSRSQSWRADCRAWASALLACGSQERGEAQCVNVSGCACDAVQMCSRCHHP